MRKGFLAVVFGLVLLWPMAGSAHELSPIYFPLGPLPFLAKLEALPFTLIVPLVVAVETWVLWMWARELGVAAHLWRVAILYVIGRAGETAGYAFTALIPGWVAPGWSSSALETYGALLICLVAGFILKLVAAWLLYRKKHLPMARITGAVGSATVAGYLSGLAWSLIISQILL